MIGSADDRRDGKMCPRPYQRMLIWASVWVAFVLIYKSLHMVRHSDGDDEKELRSLGGNPPEISVKMQSTGDQDSPNSSRARYPKMVGKQYFTPYVLNKNGQVMVYSAFIDLRRGNMGEAPTVRFMALAETHIPLNCLFDLPNGQAVHEVSWYDTPEPHGAQFAAFVLSCRIPDHFDDPIKQVKRVHLSETSSHDGAVSIPISNHVVDILNSTAPSVQTRGHQHTICVPTLYGQRYTRRHLIEFIEAHVLLGIDYFVFYVYDQDLNDFKRVLDYYRDSGRLTYFPLSLLIATEPWSIWNYAQSLVAMECIFRTAGFSRFVMLNDIDEYMVPYAADTWPELSSSILWKEPNRAAYPLKTFYFPLQLSPSENKSNLTYPSPLVTLKHIVATYEADALLTKCLIRPERVFDQGIHHVSRVIQDFYLVDKMNISVAAVHHIRQVESVFSGDHFRGGLQNATRLQDLMAKDRQLMRAYKNVIKNLGI